MIYLKLFFTFYNLNCKLRCFKFKLCCDFTFYSCFATFYTNFITCVTGGKIC